MKKIMICTLLVAAMSLAATVRSDAQVGKRWYINAGWQFNATPGNEYAEAASRMLDALSSKRADLSPETDGILQKCTGSYHGTNDREINFTYADFYFIEALMKITGQYIRIW